MNYLTIAGHLGADPETRFTPSGQKVITLRVACRARRSGKEDVSIWWKVTIWGEQFDKILHFFKKGSSIVVMGEMTKPEIYTDREGNPQISLGMVAHNLSFSPFGKKEQQEQGATGGREQPVGVQHAAQHDANQHGGAQQGTMAPSSGNFSNQFEEEEIPF